jgi:tRNA-specific 2-thiouridylase
MNDFISINLNKNIKNILNKDNYLRKNNNVNKKVMVAMSGGVDSSVAAYLLKEAGYDVTGVTMCLGVKNLDDSNPRCCGEDAINDAKKVCLNLGIPHYVFDFSEDMKKNIIEKFIQSYLEGKTPNPCIDCNKYLKFGILLNKAISLGFDYLATGHYAQILQKNDSYYLKKPIDKRKDQTYFLYKIKKENLPLIIFPLANLNKEDVREIAKSIGLSVAEKKESQEVCFVADNNYKDFLLKNAEKSLIEPGNILDINGKVIGKHNGIAFYTIGQRKGFGISAPTPLYVIKINKNTNEIVIGERKYLKSRELIAEDINLLYKGEELPDKAMAKIRYNHKEAPCKIIKINNDLIKVIFEEEQEAITRGQSVVFYDVNDGDIVLGGGTIKEVINDHLNQ